MPRVPILSAAELCGIDDPSLINAAQQPPHPRSHCKIYVRGRRPCRSSNRPDHRPGSKPQDGFICICFWLATHSAIGATEAPISLRQKGSACERGAYDRLRPVSDLQIVAESCGVSTKLTGLFNANTIAIDIGNVSEG
jgi:hypothetical protein